MCKALIDKEDDNIIVVEAKINGIVWRLGTRLSDNENFTNEENKDKLQVAIKHMFRALEIWLEDTIKLGK